MFKLTPIHELKISGLGGGYDDGGAKDCEEDL